MPGDGTGRECGDVGEQRAERHDELHAERLGEVDDQRGRRCASASTARGPRAGQVARGARARAPRRPRPPASRSSRIAPSSSCTVGRVAWKSKNSSGSIVREARRRRAPRRRSVRAAEAASPASFQPLNAHTSAGARRPSGRRSQISGCIRFTVHRWPRAAVRCIADRSSAAERRTIATLRPGDEVDGVFACTRKDRLIARTGTPYLALELRDRTGTIPARAFRDADVAGRPLRARRPRARARARRALPRRAADRACAAIAARRRGEADPAEFLPVAYRDLDELDGFLEHLAREVHDPGYRGAARARCSATTRCAPSWRRAPCTRAGHHAYLGGLLEHTVAVATLALETCRAAPAAQQRPADRRRARARPRQDARVHLRRRDRARATRAGCSATSSSACGMLDERATARPRRGPPPGARALRADAPRAEGGRRFGTAEALALYRLNALDATVKGALEHGLPA